MKIYTRIIFNWIDPFDGRLICSNNYPYDKRKSADGFYSKQAAKFKAAYKNIFSDILEGRNPKLAIKFQ